jgi:hypothetical protein
LATGALRRTATLRPVKAERATVEVERVKADIFIMCVSVTCCDLRGRPTIGVYSQLTPEASTLSWRNRWPTNSNRPVCRLAGLSTKFSAISIYTMQGSNNSYFWLPKTLQNVHAELVSTVELSHCRGTRWSSLPNWQRRRGEKEKVPSGTAALSQLKERQQCRPRRRAAPEPARRWV